MAFRETARDMAVSCHDADQLDRITNSSVTEAQFRALKIALAAGCFTLAAVATGNDVTVAAAGVATVMIEMDTFINAYIDAFDQIAEIRG